MRSGAGRALVALLAMATFGAACGHAPPPAAIGAGLSVHHKTPSTAAVPTPGASEAPSAPASLTAELRRRAVGAPRETLPPPIADARIVIPKIGVDLPVYEGIDPWTLRFGPGHWEGTAAPGQLGNIVVAGHRTTFTHPFRDIDLIDAGDDVIFVTDAGTFTYEATDAFVVAQTDTWIADATDTATFTLFACHPKGSDRQRYVVKGRLVRADTNAAPAPPPDPDPSSMPPPSTPRRCVLCGG
ncbi:MAG: sortase [Actinomycetota bacterium]